METIYIYSNGILEQAGEDVAREQSIILSVNGCEMATLIASPHALRYLVAGFIHTRGLVETVEDIYSLSVHENAGIATNYATWSPQNAWLSELADHNPSAQKILIHTAAAASRGIKDRGRICVESPVGKVTGLAKVTECIHPEVVGMAAHFGSTAKGKPLARGKGANFNKLVPFDMDPVSTGVDSCVKVKVYKV